MRTRTRQDMVQEPAQSSVWSEVSREVHPSQVRMGVKWTTGALLLTRLARFGSTVALARLLTPEHFGLVNLASAVMNVMGAARDVGFGQAYIQRRARDLEEARRAAATTFAVLFVSFAVLFVAGQAATPWLTGFFKGSKELEPILRVMFLGFPIEAFLLVPSLILQKRLEFGKQSAAEVISTLVYGAIGVSLALAGGGVWSLVAGDLASRVVQAVLLVRFAAWRPSFRFDGTIARQLFAYGKYLWGFSIVSAIGGMVDRLALGRLFGTASVGAYTRALEVCNLPATQVASLVNRIGFPTLSRLQEDRGALRSAFLKALAHVSILSFPVTIGLFAVASDLIHVLYGAAWAAASPVLEVLAFYAMILAVSSVTGPVFQAIGRPQVLLYTSLAHHAVLFSLIVLLSPYGLVGVAWAVFVPHFLSGGIAFVLVVRYLGFRPGQVIGPLIRSGVPALGMLGVIRSLPWGPRSAGWTSHLVPLLGSIFIGALTYVLLTALVNRPFLREFLRTTKEVVVAKRTV